MMRAFLIAIRTLAREWRHGELAILLLSLTVAVAALTGVSFLVDRIARAVQLQSAEVLAADIRVSGDTPIGDDLRQAGAARGLRLAERTTLLSVIHQGEASQLTNVRAVTEGYPLRGKLKVADTPFALGAITDTVPAAGEAWPDSRLAAAVGASIGSELTVGARQLRVSRILIARPDQGSTFVEFAATLLINRADLASTQLLQAGSRSNHALLLAGEDAQLRDFSEWYVATHGNGPWRLADISDESPQIGRASERAGRFLSLASLVAVMLCAVAVAMSARSYVRRHLDVVALMKTLGATRRFVLSVSIFQLLLLSLAATAAGSVVGWLTQQWLLDVLQGWLRTELPPASLAPVATALLVAVAMLGGFALPSLLQMTRVPALRVLRRDAGPPTPGLWLALAPAVGAIVFVVFGTLGDWEMSGWFILILFGAVLVLALAGWWLVRLAARWRGGAALAWRHGVANLARRKAEAVVQVVAFGLGIMLLLMLAILRQDLVNDWRNILPENAPNYFFVNIPGEEREDFRAELTGQGARLERLLPQVRGRLTAVNGVELQRRPPPRVREGASGERASRGVFGGMGGARQGGGGGRGNREQNLTWAEELGDDNSLVAGQWWTPSDHGKPLVSIATEYAEDLDLKLGDELRFDVAGELFNVRVSSIREVKWDSFRPNFFIVFAPGVLDGAAGTYMTSAEFEPRTAAAMAQLVRRFPSVSIFNVGDLLAQIRAVVSKAVTAVQSVFVFTLLAGLTVLLAAVQSSRDERALETAVLRVLGAARATVRKSVLAEFAALGLVAGFLATTGAALGGWALALQLGLNYHFNAPLWIGGLAMTVLIVGYGGWHATRTIVNHPPSAVLR